METNSKLPSTAISPSRKRPREATLNGNYQQQNSMLSLTTSPIISTYVNGDVNTNGLNSISSSSNNNFMHGLEQHHHPNVIGVDGGSSVDKMDCLTIRKPAPVSTDHDAIIERNRCDYKIKITKQMAETGNTPRRVRVYADGIYDLFHQGHARQLMQAKTIFPNVYLIVGVCSDELTHSKKGRTVMNDLERYEAVRHCRYVDEIVTNAPWEISDAFLEDNKIDFVAHDEIPYGAEDSNDIYAPLKARGMFVATKRTEGVSTSDIVARIVKDYDLYVRRNLARGYSAKELNVSFLKEKKFRLQNKMDELKDRGKRVMNEVKEDIIKHWDEKSRDFIETFLLLFGRERLSTIWNESKGRIMQAFSPPGSPHGSENGDVDNYYDEDDDDNNGHDDNDDAAEKRNSKSTNKLTKTKHNNINKNINHLNNNNSHSDDDDDDDDDDEYCEAEFSDDNQLDSPPVKRSLKLSMNGNVNGNNSLSSTNNTSAIIVSKTLSKEREHVVNSVTERPSL